MVVGRLLSYWEGNFSGAMLNFGGAILHSLFVKYFIHFSLICKIPGTYGRNPLGKINHPLWSLVSVYGTEFCALCRRGKTLEESTWQSQPNVPKFQCPMCQHCFFKRQNLGRFLRMCSSSVQFSMIIFMK